MSNKSEIQTEDSVIFRHQTRVNKSIMEAFENECREQRRQPDFILRAILEERYGKQDRRD